MLIQGLLMRRNLGLSVPRKIWGLVAQYVCVIYKVYLDRQSASLLTWLPAKLDTFDCGSGGPFSLSGWNKSVFAIPREISRHNVSREGWADFVIKK